jgi:hypothetical protein
MPSEGWWSRHRMFPALSLAVIADCPTTLWGALFGWLRSSVCILNFHVMYIQTFITSCNHSAAVAKEKASYHISLIAGVLISP